MMRLFKLVAFTLVAAGAILGMPASARADEPEFLISLEDPMAAFLESRVYAGKQGATAEFQKMEGVALDPANNKLYLAMAEVDEMMSDDQGHLKLSRNNCGVVYEAALDEAYNITHLKAAVVGGPFNSDSDAVEHASGFKDRCDVNNMANPDNLFVDGKGRLWITEDTHHHFNNALWMWDGQTLRRFATIPSGAEVTGLHITQDGTLFFNVQHPAAMSKYPYNRSVIGVVNGFKATDNFTPLPVPAGDDTLTVKVAAGEYQVLGRAGEVIPGDMHDRHFGQVNDTDNNFMVTCNNPDGNMYLPIDEAGTEGYLFTNFECRPGAVSRLYLRQNGEAWDVLEGESVNFEEVDGSRNNCNGSVTPWNTALIAEEYEPLAVKDEWRNDVRGMTKYLGKQANPYNYGYPVELIPDPTGESLETLVVKHYAMGRFSYEMSVVMPDGKTAYSGDDVMGAVLFKYVADEPGDLSAGTLYAARATQKADESLDLTWIKLGQSNNDAVYEAIQAVELPER